MIRMYDCILKKRSGFALTKEEIAFFVDGVTHETIPDYQTTALLMAIYFQGMTEEETIFLTHCMAKSGDLIDLSSIDGIKVDKHSTGGVGDKTTLIVAPMVASLGVKVAKMSGRGLGHTGGTIDKLESIPGFQTGLSFPQFIATAQKTGIALAGQTGNFVPADKKLYALRDVTATVDLLPLIASSIMSKKIAAGADCIVLDVKCGNGAFMKTKEEATALADCMVKIGKAVGKKTIALISNMDVPLGNTIGNALEVQEAIQVLHGQGEEDITNLCITLAANMLFLAEKGTLDECEQMAKASLTDGSALAKFAEWIAAQGGNPLIINDSTLLPQAPFSCDILAQKNGCIQSMQTEQIGIAAMVLGAGRETKTSPIDFSAGIRLYSKTGDTIQRGERIATFYTSDKEKFSPAIEIFQRALRVK